MPENIITRADFAREIYSAYHLADLPYDALTALIERLYHRLDLLNSVDTFADLDYRHPLGRELWFTAALGYFADFRDGKIEPERELLPEEMAQTLSILPLECDKLVAVIDGAKSTLAKAAALLLYKKARAAVFSDSFAHSDRDALFSALEQVKTAHRDFGEARTIVGTPDFPRDYIYAYEPGPFVREVEIASSKPETRPIEIVMTSDAHYNLVNDDDFAEANPSVMSTFEGRKWLAGGASVGAVRNALNYAEFSDQTIVAGDILDFLSLGCQELAVNEMFRRDLDILVSPGGHDITRVMQGQVPDPTTYKSRIEILETFWPCGFYYDSKILGGKVMTIVMDNDMGYKEVQLAKLKSDLVLARRDGLIVLIFQHEQICTANPDDTEVPIIRKGDPSGGSNFSPSGRMVGADKWTGITREIYELIRSSSDVIKGLFCGHWHNDIYTEVVCPDGSIIPQYVNTACPYDNAGHVIKITVK